MKKISNYASKIYLVLLLIAVVIYGVVFIPGFIERGSQNKADLQAVNDNIASLEVYEAQLPKLAAETQELLDKYDADTRLAPAARFADDLCAAAKSAGVGLLDIAVYEDGYTKAHEGRRNVYRADITIAVEKGTSPVQFLNNIENTEGAAYFVMEMAYESNSGAPNIRVPEQGQTAVNQPIGQKSERGVNTPAEQKTYVDAQSVDTIGFNAGLYDVITISVQMVTLVK